MPNLNIPEPDDPNFNSKIVALLKDLFQQVEGQVQHLPPTDDPDDAQQEGTIWFSESEQKVKVVTATGVKILKFE